MSEAIQDSTAWLLPLALVIALAALATGMYLLVVARRYRHDQKVITGDGDSRDLLTYGRELQEQMDAIGVETEALRARLAESRSHLADCLVFRSVLRYDAYRDLSGMQSTSMALLDANFSGIVISSIQSRDHARIYVREIVNGESREKLSPEDIHVLKQAMGFDNPVPETAVSRLDV